MSAADPDTSAAPPALRDCIEAVRTAAAGHAWAELAIAIERLHGLLAATPRMAPRRAELVQLASAAVTDARREAETARDAVGAELDVLRRGRRAVRAYG
ncbi:MAG: hypothetical protein RLW62_16230 [Gammaproteobacteria bacterium]